MKIYLSLNIDIAVQLYFKVANREQLNSESVDCYYKNIVWLKNLMIYRNLPGSKFHNFSHKNFRESIKIIATIQYSTAPLRKSLCKFKDRRPVLKLSRVVYEIKCTSCNTVYIRKTGRLVEERMAEHKQDIRNKKKESLAFCHMNNMEIFSTLSTSKF